MRNSLFPVLFLLLSGLQARAQSCLPQGITFNSQAGIDNFPAAYPGCKTIEGTVRIEGPGITNLNGLSAITAMGDSLLIYECSALTSLSGLSQLSSVGGGLSLAKNHQLNDLQGLEMLHTIGKDLLVTSNGILKGLNGLQGLTSLGGSIYIQNNPQLNSVSALSNLGDTLNSVHILENYPLANGAGLFDNVRHIRGDLWMTGGSINSVAHLAQLETIGGSLQLSSPAPLSLNGLQALRSVDGNFWLTCQQLNSLQPLAGLNRIGGTLHISQNYALNNLTELSSLTQLGSLTLDNNPALTGISGLNTIDTLLDLQIRNNPALANLDGLEQLTAIQGDLRLQGNPVLTDFSGLDLLHSVGNQIVLDPWKAPDLSAFSSLDSIGGNLAIVYAQNITSLDGLGNLRHLGGLSLGNCDNLATLSGMNGVQRLEKLDLYNCPVLTDFTGLENIRSISSDLTLFVLDALNSMNGLGSLDSLGNLRIAECPKLATLTGMGPVRRLNNLYLHGSAFNGQTPLPNLHGLDSVKTIAGDLELKYLNYLDSLSGLEQLDSIGGKAILNGVGAKSLQALSQLNAIGDTLKISFTPIHDFTGLERLKSVRHLDLSFNNRLKSLDGLDSLDIIAGDLSIAFHDSLSTLDGLAKLSSVGGQIQVYHNNLLSDCAIAVICHRLATGAGSPPNVYVNAYGCESPAAIALQCGGEPLRAQILLDNNNNCLADDGDTPAADLHVLLEGDDQTTLRPTNSQGSVLFYYLPSDLIRLSLPQFPAGNWGVCRDTLVIDPDTLDNTTAPTFLLSPLNPCPELTVDLSLPEAFRGCFVPSYINILLNNTGAVPAKDFTIALVLPPVLNWFDATPWPAAVNGDTLFFDFTGAELPPFTLANIPIQVSTSCDTFLLGQTLCVEAFALFDNPCATTPVAFSEVKLSAACLGDTLVRFTLRNTGDAPTQAPHSWSIYKNATLHDSQPFSLGAQQSTTVDVPADGATWRMEATKFDDGTLTATALENCGGLTSGQITAFWLDEGPAGYDFDCRLVIGSYDPNEKSAVPMGAGLGNRLAPNRPLVYTINFQNTGTDTAFRVLLRDVLSPELDVSTFRPAGSSHPCVWEIRGLDTLEVLFYPIFLPDSNTNESASQGYFRFEIQQKPDLSDGVVIENTAAIIFDYNPPIVTNTVVHTIGRATVRTNEPERAPALWQVFGNPARHFAGIRALKTIPGEKRLALYDTGGRLLFTDRFSGQEYRLQRQGMPAGLYFLRIADDRERVFSGKVVWME